MFWQRNCHPVEDPKSQRLVVTSGHTPEDRLYLLKLDPTKGALSVHDAFRDPSPAADAKLSAAGELTRSP